MDKGKKRGVERVYFDVERYRDDLKAYQDQIKARDEADSKGCKFIAIRIVPPAKPDYFVTRDGRSLFDVLPSEPSVSNGPPTVSPSPLLLPASPRSPVEDDVGTDDSCVAP